MVGLDSSIYKPEVTKIYHDCHHWYWQCSAICPGFTEVEAISQTSPPPIIKAGAAPAVPKVEFNFFDDCGVAELAKKINLDLTGTLKQPKKSRKEPITDANNNPKEAIKTAHISKI